MFYQAGGPNTNEAQLPAISYHNYSKKMLLVGPFHFRELEQKHPWATTADRPASMGIAQNRHQVPKDAKICRQMLKDYGWKRCYDAIKMLKNAPNRCQKMGEDAGILVHQPASLCICRHLPHTERNCFAPTPRR